MSSISCNQLASERLKILYCLWQFVHGPTNIACPSFN